MPRKNKVPTNAAPVESYKHKDKRTRIPTQEESVKLSPRDKQPVKTKYAYDPSLDPQLVWAGKQESGNELGVSTVPIYVQEKVAPEAIIARLKAGADDNAQMMLFGDTAQTQFDKAVEFYKHEDNWQNRMILGDSLLVMNSLLEKEGMRSKVQCVYIDPPYGIKFGSNWQVSTRKRDVKDNKVNDFIRQPEQVKAFRDTWELGIHSYLSYLRDRLITSRELLTDSGSCFVQISDQNLHLVRGVMDEVFGSENFVALVAFRKTGSQDSKTLGVINDFLIFYAKDISKLKFRKLYIEKNLQNDDQYRKILLKDGTVRNLKLNEDRTIDELPQGAKIFQATSLQSDGKSDNLDYKFEYLGGIFEPNGKSHWKTSLNGLKRLAEVGRIIKSGKNIRYIRFFNDFPYMELSSFWTDTYAASNMIYAVQTAELVIQRAILMTTDPGDIVLDPTCGSGSSALIAEQWGRRWITVDTSRVALALARTRLMSAKFQYYRLKNDMNISSGFEYKTVPHITLKSLANNEEAEQEVLYDKPLEDKDKIRVTGPFTVESLSPHRVSDAQEMLSSERFIETVVSNLLKAGVQTGQRGARLEFVNLDILPKASVQAVGEYKSENSLRKVAVAIGPEFGSIDDDFIRTASQDAKRFADLLVVAGTSFEAAAFAEPSEIDGLRVMKVKINPDLSMGDLLKKTGAGNLFLAFGEPEIRLNITNEGYSIEIVGVDVYDPVKNEIRSSGSGDPEHEIAAWFIDTNYSGEAFFITHAYFLGADKPYERLKKALKADINEEVWDSLYSTKSRPFTKPSSGKIAVKVINHYGDEVMKIVEIK